MQTKNKQKLKIKKQKLKIKKDEKFEMRRKKKS